MANLHVGDRILYKDTGTNKNFSGKVTDVLIKYDKGTVYTVVLDNGLTYTCGPDQLVKLK